MEVQPNEPVMPGKVCLNCGNTAIVPNVPNPLCSTCRTAAIKFPIPLWVKLFGGGILLLVVISLIFLPESITLGINLERGKAAADNQKYFTAEKYFKQAVKLDSDNLEANTQLFVASFYNNDLETFFNEGGKISGKTLDDDVLASRINLLFSKADYHYPSDSFMLVEKPYGCYNSMPTAIYANYLHAHNSDVFAQLMYASSLFDKQEYAACDSMLQAVLNNDDENLDALTMMASAKRFENQNDSAIEYCNRALALNSEYAYAQCLKARALLKLKRNSEAMNIVQQCTLTDSSNAYTLATLALVYHCNNQPQQRDAVLHRAEITFSDSSYAPVFQYVHDVINNKQSL